MFPLRHRYVVLALFLALLLILGAGAAQGGADAKATDTLNARLFPMKVGDQWLYAFGDKEVTFEVLRTEKSGGITVYIVRRTFEKTQVDYRLAVEESGVYIHQEGKKVFSPPLRQFAFIPRTGDVWKWRGTAGGKRVARRFEHLGVDKVTVPAGTYSAIRVHEKEDNGDHATFWLAEGVGVVMLSGKSELLGGRRIVFEWKLKRFSRSKK
jgi:hypothetical protein